MYSESETTGLALITNEYGAFRPTNHPTIVTTNNDVANRDKALKNLAVRYLLGNAKNFIIRRIRRYRSFRSGDSNRTYCRADLAADLRESTNGHIFGGENTSDSQLRSERVNHVVTVRVRTDLTTDDG